MSEAKVSVRGQLRLLDATMLVVGSMIGSGIFIVSADIARNVGSSGWLLLVWLVSGVMTLIPAVSYGELSGMYPQAGGQYVYLRNAYNPLIGFLYGWTFFMVIQCGTIAAVAVAFAKFTAVLIPWFSEQHVLFEVSGLTFSAAQLLALFNITVLTYLNMQGLREGKFVQNLFTFSKIAVLVLLIVLGFSLGLNPDVVKLNFANAWEAMRATVGENGQVIRESLSGADLLSACGLGCVGAIFALDAWNSSTFTAAETHNPRKTIAQSLALGTALVTGLYVLTNVAYLFMLPVIGDPNGADVIARGFQFAASDRIATASVETLLGGAAAIVVAICVMISTFGCNNGIVLTGARVYYAMSQHGLFFKDAQKINKHGVPGVALVMQGLWSGVLCLSGKYGDLLDYVVFATVLFYVLTVWGIIRLRTLRPDEERPFRAPGYPYLQIAYLIFAVLFSVNLLIYKPQYTWPGLFIVLLGIPVYYLWRKNPERHSPTLSS
ncbi:amino acid permease [bacterium]|nr:amino acid permease [bacterium]